MRFLAPQFLQLAWLALIPLLLYLFRKQARRVPVSTLLFFRSLAREHQESAWLRRWKRWLSLLLTLLVLLLTVLALARPARDLGAGAPAAVVLLLDRSASMAARDGAGRTRLEQARLQLRQRLLALPDAAVVSLVVFDAKPRVLLSRSRNRRECLRLLDEVRPLPREGRPEAALAVVRRLAALEPNSRVWHAGDRPLPVAEGLACEFLNVALAAPAVNAGITGFQIRPAPLNRGRYEVFVKVAAGRGNPGPLPATLEVTLADRLVQLRELELAPGQSNTLILPLEGVCGQMLKLRLQAAGDCLGWDDAVAAALPQARPLVVGWVAEQPDPFTEIALVALIEAGRIEMLRSQPSDWPLPAKPDVYIFEHWLPPVWPDDRPALVLEPRQSGGPLRLQALPGRGLPHEQLRSPSPEHPVLFRVGTPRLAVTQTAVLTLTGGLEPLWLAGSDPLLAAGEVQGQRLVVSAFSPAGSERLALLPALPLLLGNALYWATEPRAALAEAKVWRPGDLVPARGFMEWTEWNGEQFLATSETPVGEWLELSRLGTWREGTAAGGISLLASAEEADLPVAAAAAVRESPLAAVTAGSRLSWPQGLIVAVLALLLLESLLFHRKAVY